MLSGLADLRGDDPELYQRKIRELHLEATVASLAIEARRASLDTSPQSALMRDSLQAQLQAMVRAQVLTNLDNRAAFAQRLREHLDQMELDVEIDRGNVDGLVQDRIEALATP
jgi:PleD family two-component response regulator